MSGLFDFLIGLFAVGNAAIEVAAIQFAKKSENRSQTSFVAPDNPCFEE